MVNFCLCIFSRISTKYFFRGCGGTGTIVSVHNTLYVGLIDKMGTKEQKEKFLPSFTDGTAVGAFALSEPGNLECHYYEISIG